MIKIGNHPNHKKFSPKIDTDRSLDLRCTQSAELHMHNVAEDKFRNYAAWTIIL